MKTIKTVEVTPVFVQYIPKEMEEGKIYISQEFDVSVHLCLCGCKNKTVLPLNEGGWNLLIEDKERITFTPSISNFQLPCKAHYIITRNKANFV